MSEEIIFKSKYRANNGPHIIVDYLAQNISLSKIKIKENMLRGGCWLKKNNRSKMLRVRRAKAELQDGDLIEFYYLPENNIKLAEPFSLMINKDYSIWYKPALWFSQGTKYGDDSSLLRYVEQKYGPTFLIHRLDREVTGLMLFAHNNQMAQYFSNLIQERKLIKKYEAVVEGLISESIPKEINLPIDDKEAITQFTMIKKNNVYTFLDIQIITGRKHQIRRHMQSIGHPILGDIRYGGKRFEKICLAAYELSFLCPISKKTITITLPQEYRQWPI